ncbi:MAG: endonuclease domain-containing protein [Prevotella sp.]|nr:endonuclease domain-containing protein [Prevotella sp.]
MEYRYKTADPMLYGLLLEHARYNRNHPTEAEAILWDYLRAERLGVAFKRQHIIGDYIVDFVCLPARLIIELDGGYHQIPRQQVEDAQRTEWLESKGYRVLRFTNEDLFHGIDRVLDKINDYLV